MTKTILITGARAPVALHLTRILACAGHRVILADSQNFPLSRGTRFKHRYYKLPSPVIGIEPFGRAIEKIIQSESCDLILPTCEEIFYLAAWRDLYARNLPLLAPSFEKLKSAHNKFEFSVSTQGLSLEAPETILLNDAASITDFKSDPSHYVFKPVWSRFAAKVLLCPNRQTLSAVIPTASAPWIAQKFLAGEELCTWAWAHAGKLLALSSYRPLNRVGLGAAIAFAPIVEPEIEKFVAEYCEMQNWSGQISFDFRRDVDGKLHVIECNPRATSGAHFFGPQAALATTILDQSESMPNIKGAMTLPLAMVAFGLPQAMKSDGLAGFKKWVADMRSLASITAWQGDHNLLPMQVLSLLEIAGKAMCSGMPLTTAATSDIEWNGNDLGPKL